MRCSKYEVKKTECLSSDYMKKNTSHRHVGKTLFANFLNKHMYIANIFPNKTFTKEALRST